MSRELTVYTAYILSGYMIASIFYVVMTMKTHSPFRASLTMSQIDLLKTSESKQFNVFLLGASIATAILFWTRPFRFCD